MKTPLLHSLLVAGSLLLSSILAPASDTYKTDFTGTAGPFETAQGYDNWKVQRSSVAVSTSLILNGDGLLQITNPSDGSASSLFGGAMYTGNTSITDGYVAGSFQYVAAGGQSAGLLARVQNPLADGSRPEGYFAGILRYNPGGGNKTFLVIAKDIAYAGVSEYLLASVEISVSSGNFYQMQFAFEGDTLTATLFNAAGDREIATLGATDNTYASGAVGFRANFGGKGQTIGFDSFEVTAIPEPSTALLLSGAGVVALFCFRNKISSLK